MAHFIGIAGTHSTGKTTFVKELCGQAEARGISVGMVSDTATQAQKTGFPILQNHTFESTLWIMTAVIKAELEAGLKADLVVVDRPVPDALGYLEAALSATSRSISLQQRDYLYALARHHAQCYSLLLKTTLDESIPLGAGRDGDLTFRRDADRRIGGALGEMGLEHLDPMSDIARQRIQSLLQQLA